MPVALSLRSLSEAPAEPRDLTKEEEMLAKGARAAARLWPSEGRRNWDELTRPSASLPLPNADEAEEESSWKPGAARVWNTMAC